MSDDPNRKNDSTDVSLPDVSLPDVSPNSPPDPDQTAREMQSVWDAPLPPRVQILLDDAELSALLGADDDDGDDDEFPDLPYTEEELAAMSPDEQLAAVDAHFRRLGFAEDLDIPSEEELAEQARIRREEDLVEAMATLYPDLTLQARAEVTPEEVRERVAQALGIPPRGLRRGDFMRDWDSGDPADRADLITGAASLVGVPSGLDLSAALFGETYPSADGLRRVDAATGLASGRGGARSWQLASQEADREADQVRHAAAEARNQTGPVEVEFPARPGSVEEDRESRAERARALLERANRDWEEAAAQEASEVNRAASHEDVSAALTPEDQEALSQAAASIHVEWDPAAALSQEQLDARPPAELVVELLSSLEGAAEAAQDLLGRVGGVLRAEPGKLPAALRALRGWASAVVEASKTADDGLMSASDLFTAPADLPPLNSLAAASAGMARPAPEPRADVPPEVREALEARVREHNTRRLPPRWAARTGDAAPAEVYVPPTYPPAVAGPAAVALVGDGVFPARAQGINPEMRATLSGPLDVRAPVSVRGELSLIAPAPADQAQAQAQAQDQAQAPAEDQSAPANLARVLERHHRARSGRDEDRARAEAARNRASARATEAVLDPAEIQSMRETLGLSVGELAERAGVDPDFVRDLEEGDLHPHQRWRAVRVLHVLEVAGQPPHPSEGRSVSLSAVRATTVMSSAALRDAILGPPLSDLQEGGRNVVTAHNPARPPLSPPTASFRLEHDRVPGLAERFASGLPDDGAALRQEVEALVSPPEPDQAE